MIALRRGDHGLRFVGVVHLLPLPGAPVRADLDAALARARHDARALVQGGADAVIVENFGDAPFAPRRVPAATISAMTRAVGVVRDAAPGLDVGVNVLRNDALAAMAIAACTGSDFIRVNVLSGVMVTDQGVIEGEARDLIALRTALGAQIAVVADVMVKHATPLGSTSLEDAARDTWHRAGADVVVVTGRGTGLPTSLDDADRVRAVIPEAPLWVGSGVTLESAEGLRARVDGAIVGTWLHEDGSVRQPLCPRRVEAMRRVLKG